MYFLMGLVVISHSYATKYQGTQNTYYTIYKFEFKQMIAIDSDGK